MFPFIIAFVATTLIIPLLTTKDTSPEILSTLIMVRMICYLARPHILFRVIVRPFAIVATYTAFRVSTARTRDVWQGAVAVLKKIRTMLPTEDTFKMGHYLFPAGYNEVTLPCISTICVSCHTFVSDIVDLVTRG